MNDSRSASEQRLPRYERPGFSRPTAKIAFASLVGVFAFRLFRLSSFHFTAVSSAACDRFIATKSGTPSYSDRRNCLPFSSSLDCRSATNLSRVVRSMLKGTSVLVTLSNSRAQRCAGLIRLGSSSSWPGAVNLRHTCGTVLRTRRSAYGWPSSATAACSSPSGICRHGSYSASLS